jgi:uncharacterized protein HemY
LQYEKADRQISKCLAVWPNNYQANLLAARISRGRADYLQAEKHLAVCLKQQGKTEDTDLEWILLQAQKGDFLKLEYQMRNWAEQGHPQSKLILEAMVFCYLQDGRFGMAHHTLHQWLEKQPSAVGHMWRGLAAFKMGFAKAAEMNYRHALEMDPDLREARVQLVQLLFFESAFDEGRDHLRILEQTYSGTPDVLLLTGMDHFQKGELAEAEKCYDLVLQTMPENSLALYQRGKLALQKEQYAQAEDWFRRALAAEPDMPAAHFSLCQCLRLQPGKEQAAVVEMARYKENLERLRRQQIRLEALAKKPNDPELLVEVGEFFLQNKEWSRARQYLERALQIRPDHEKGRQLLAATLKGSG